MSDYLTGARCDTRWRSVRLRLGRLALPLLLLSLSLIPGLVSLRVYESVPFAVVVVALTAMSIGAAAVLFRPR